MRKITISMISLSLQIVLQLLSTKTSDVILDKGILLINLVTMEKERVKPMKSKVS